MPISERFFAGGANTLRSASILNRPGRVWSSFRRGSSATAAVTRLPSIRSPCRSAAMLSRWSTSKRGIPLSDWVRAVPFYDGGNVFRSVSDIFKAPAVPSGDVFRQNLRATWSHTVGLGLRLKTPIGGEFGVDYGFLLNPPEFLIPQVSGPKRYLPAEPKPTALPILAGVLKMIAATVFGPPRKCLLNISSEARMPERTHLFRSNLNSPLMKLCGFRPVRRSANHLRRSPARAGPG